MLEGYIKQNNRPLGYVTDDTQLTVFTLNGLLSTNEQTFDEILKSVYLNYLAWYAGQSDEDITFHDPYFLKNFLWLWDRRAPGNTCLNSLKDGYPGDVINPINNSNYCGGVMRIAPVGFVSDLDAYHLGVKIAALTHGGVDGYVPAGILALLIKEIINGNDLKDSLFKAISFSKKYHPNAKSTHKKVEFAISLAGKPDLNPEDIETLGQGWRGDEALAIALCAVLATSDIRRSLGLAVTHSGDSDSTGSIAGSILGALYGYSSLPQDLTTQVEGRELYHQLAIKSVEML